MADKSFDVVIVGGGNKGLIAAMYLARYGGMEVGIFEEKHELGSGWCEEESPAPGFMAHHCSHYHIPDTYHIPVYEDFPEWKEYGAEYVYAPLTVGCVFIEDDSWIGVYSKHIDPHQEKTAKLIARFSEKDAETWLYFWDKMEKHIRPAVLEYIFSPAQPLGVPDALDRLLANPESGMDPLWAFMSPAQVFKDIFESPEAQLIFARVMQSAGITPEMYGSGLGMLLWWAILPTAGQPKGGNHQLAHASQRVILENGGKVFALSPVDKIIIENGKAKGIRLSDGTEIEAKKAVLTDVDPYQLCIELIGEEHLERKIIRRIKNLERDWITISWYTWALHERPRYKAEIFHSDLPYMWWICLGTKKMEDIMEEAHIRRLHKWPDPQKFNLVVSDHSIHQPGILAPEGKACVLTEQFVNHAAAYSEKEWKEIEKRHAQEILDFWQKFAPNMTWDNVIGYVPVTPFFTSKHARNWGPYGNWCVIDNSPSQVGRLRPIPELASGRMPIKNLYATGSGWHPFGNGSSCQGYNIYKVMAEDLGLKKPWEEKKRPF